MTLKIIVFILLLVVIKMFHSFYTTNRIVHETPINQKWWDGLSEEWKSILLINQNFSKQGSDIYLIQQDYVNRAVLPNEEFDSPMNTSLHDLFEMRKFGLGYPDFYARALREGHVTENKQIDLTTLSELEIIYMVNGPGDLTPLKKFPNLKTLILTDCGIDNEIPLKEQLLDLEPLRNLKKLQVLHCSSNALKTIEPIKDFVELKELILGNSNITDISPLKKLVNLEFLSIGSKVKSTSVIAKLINLKVLFLNGSQHMPDFSKLSKLKRLSIQENEMAITDGSYRIENIEFLKDLPQLEYLDLDNTSYKGSLALMDSFQNLRAITLPPVNTSTMLEFKKHHTNCIITNAFRYEN